MNSVKLRHYPLTDKTPMVSVAYGVTGKPPGTSAVRTARAWMRRRVEAGEPALSGMFTRAEVTYAWPREDGTVGSDREPVALFTGEAVHAYLGHLPDAAIEAMLNELAAELGAALGQERIYVAFCPRSGWLGLKFGPAFEGSQLLAGCSVVEAKFGLFEKEGKVGFRNAVVSTERALGLVPEVLNSVDVIVAIENVGV